MADEASAPPAPAPSWRDVVLQLSQTAITVGAALTLAILGKVSGEVALGAIVAGGAPAFMRLAQRLRAAPTSQPTPRPPA